MVELSDAIAELRTLNETTPSPPRLPTEPELLQACARAGVSLHPDLRRYLLEASDVVFGALEPVTIGAGHTELGSVVESARHAGVPVELVPFCEDNGDYYCIASDGSVVFWSHNGSTDERWPSLARWIVDVWISEG